ncbi:MAG: hypothetical protein VX223_08365 [Myxococcota bacterium]|nr:hypothetical protein [Myxococcota bacterium]
MKNQQGKALDPYSPDITAYGAFLSYYDIPMPLCILAAVLAWRGMV